MQENPNSVQVDSGNLSKEPEKLGVVMAALKESGCDAVGVGDADLRLADNSFIQEAEKSKLTIVSAAPDAPKVFVPYVIKRVGNLNVGIVSFGAVSPENTDQYAFRKSRYLAYKTARASCDILIVLDQSNTITADWLGRIGARLGAPDIVVGGVRNAGISEPQVIGKTHIVPTGQETREIGVVDVRIVRGEEPRYSWKRVMNMWDTKAKTGDADEDLKVKTLVWEFLRPGQVVPGSVPSAPPPLPTDGKPYYASVSCKSCHVKQYEDWAKTKHATAIKTLVKAERMLPECLACHSEQYRRSKAVSVPTDDIGGVECATCHINALPHGMERGTVAARTRVSAMGCIECHTAEHSPRYDEQAYFPMVSHLDTARSASADAAVKSPH